MQQRLLQMDQKETFPFKGLTAVSLYVKSLYVLAALYPFSRLMIAYSFLSFIPILFFLSFSLLLNDRLARRYLVGMNILGSVVFFADVLYIRGFGRLLSLYVIFATGIADDMGGSVLSLVRPLDIILFLDLPLIWYVFTRLRKTRLVRNFTTFVITALLTGLIIGIAIRQLEVNKITADLKKLPLFMSPLGNHIYDGFRYSQEKDFVVSSEELEQINDWHRVNEAYQVPAPADQDLEGILRGKNLIVVQFESLENFLIGKSYFGQEITPNLNRLLDSSFYFSNLIEQVNEGNSSDAELLFNTSLYPLDQGSAFLRFADNQYRSLPRILNTKGYTSIALHGDDAEFWNRNNVFPHLGFDRYVDETQFLIDHQAGMGVLDEYLFDQAIHEMRRLPRPFNMFLITMTSHIPFKIPEELHGLTFEAEDEATDYLQAIHYVDQAFGRFYDELERSGILKDSVLVIYGDHEGLHKYYETELADNGKRLPYIVHAPGLEGRTISKPAGQVDMMPTLLYLMGVEPALYEDTVMGRNLFGAASGSPVFPNGDIFAPVDGLEHLRAAYRISDIAIRSQYHQKHLAPLITAYRMQR